MLPNQQDLHEAIIEKLGGLTQPTLIVIAGMSGVGKSYLLDQLRPQLESFGAGLIEYGVTPNEYAAKRTCFVSTATPWEVARLAEEGLPNYMDGYDLVVYVLKGMDRATTQQYLADKPCKISPEAVCSLSMGVPVLADRIIRHALSEDEAAILVTEYLRGHWLHGTDDQEALASQLRPYLQMMPASKVQEMLNQRSYVGFYERGIYSHLEHFYSQVETMKHQNPVVSPYFVAPESEGIYNGMVLGPRDTGTQIRIFVPALPRATAVDFADAFNENNRFGRIRLCGGNERKTVALIRFSADKPPKELFNYECSWVHDLFDPCLAAYEADGIPLLPQGGADTSCFYVLTRDHPGMIGNQIHVGWAVESYCQQIGLPYYVENSINASAYVYNPETEQIKRCESINRLF